MAGRRRRIIIDRQTAYSGAIGAATDVLYNARFSLVALGLLAQDLLGTGTIVFGAAVTPGAGLTVAVSPGRIYTQVEIDATAWSSLPANTTLIQKQGILLNALALTVPAPVTAGDSINYLIEGIYVEQDQNFAVLEYYNAANPAQPFAGAGNNGVAQPKTRAGFFLIQPVAGTPATTGSQTTPSTTAGYVPLAVVTVAFGATSITTGNIAIAAAAPYALLPSAGSFTLTATGMTGTVTGTAYYSTDSNRCTLQLPVLSGTSNVDTFTATGLPAALQPVSYSGVLNNVCPLALAVNNSAYVAGAYASIAPGSGTISFGLLGSLAGWATSGTKSAAGTITYLLND